MAVWKPEKDIGDSELIGRRLIDKASKLREAESDGTLKFSVNDFYDTRDGDLSIDRLGDPNPNKDTLRELSLIHI